MPLHHHHGMEHLMGLLKLKILKGVNLAVRDSLGTSDPYVIVTMGNRQKLKTRVVKKNTNPEWNEELTLSVADPNLPIKVMVYDKDVFSMDDKMGDAEFHIGPFLEAQKTIIDQHQLPNGTIISKLHPGRDNCYAEDSNILWKDGKVVQTMVLRLRNVERGEVELEIHWVDIPGSRGLSM